MNRLTLSILDRVVAKAKKFAERHNTSVSALVEEFLDEVSDDDNGIQFSAATEEQIAAIRNGVIAVHPDARLGTLPRCDEAVYLEDGTLVVAEAFAQSAKVMSYRAKLRRDGYVISRVLFVSLADLGSLFKTELEYNYSRMQKETLMLLEEATKAGAQNIYIESQRYEANIRFRINGDMSLIRQTPSQFSTDLMAALFNMADCSDVSYRSTEFQEALMTPGNPHIPAGLRDVRFTFVPTIDGAMCSIALHYISDIKDLEFLGYSPRQLAAILSALDDANGLHLFSGRTGTGKTISLGSAIAAHAQQYPSRMRVTADEFIEQRLPNTIQCPVRGPERDYNMEKAIRIISATMPDLFSVGSIRTAGVAQAAATAARNGLNVWASTHAASAVGTIVRMLHLSLSPEQAQTIKLVVNQDLLPKLCPECRKPLDYNSAEHIEIIQWLKTKAAGHNLGMIPVNATIFVTNPDGCSHCHKGRYKHTLVAEVFRPTVQDHQDILNDNISAVERRLFQQGMTMRQHALEKVFAGEIDPYVFRRLFPTDETN
jgi:type IV pilus assembly protein PilB